MAESLQEYVVRLGTDVDSNGIRKLQDALKENEKLAQSLKASMENLGKSMEKATKAMGHSAAESDKSSKSHKENAKAAKEAAKAADEHEQSTNKNSAAQRILMNLLRGNTLQLLMMSGAYDFAIKKGVDF